MPRIHLYDMILKSFGSFFITLLSFFYYYWIILFDNGVSAVLQVPANIQPGQTITAEIIIKKANIGGFAKLQIEAGQGLTIEESDNKGAAFSFSGNTAKWIWTALPLEAEFKVKFKITAAANASGTTNISGKFSYIENNAKQVVEIPQKEIIIGNQPAESPIAIATATNTPAKPDSTNITTTSVPTTTTNPPVSTTTTGSIPNNTTPASTKIQLNRTIENIAPNVWLLKIQIQKDTIKGFARYTDVLPVGLKASAESKDGSSFFVDGNQIKFVWSSLPDKPSLNISYKLSGTLAEPVTIQGNFSYTENNQITSQSLTPETIQPSTIANNTPPAPNNVAQTSTQAKQTTVFFSVQLGAFLKSRIQPSYFTRKYSIPNVQTEQHESYRKFYSGKFEEYKQARDYREEIKIKGITDAFVIAHKNNIRITVQEALMITNQKWFP